MSDFMAEGIAPSGIEPKCQNCILGRWLNPREEILPSLRHMHS